MEVKEEEINSLKVETAQIMEKEKQINIKEMKVKTEELNSLMLENAEIKNTMEEEKQIHIKEMKVKTQELDSLKVVNAETKNNMEKEKRIHIQEMKVKTEELDSLKLESAEIKNTMKEEKQIHIKEMKVKTQEIDSLKVVNDEIKNNMEEEKRIHIQEMKVKTKELDSLKVENAEIKDTMEEEKQIHIQEMKVKTDELDSLKLENAEIKNTLEKEKSIHIQEIKLKIEELDSLKVENAEIKNSLYRMEEEKQIHIQEIKVKIRELDSLRVENAEIKNRLKEEKQFHIQEIKVKTDELESLKVENVEIKKGMEEEKRMHVQEMKVQGQELDSLKVEIIEIKNSIKEEKRIHIQEIKVKAEKLIMENAETANSIEEEIKTETDELDSLKLENTKIENSLKETKLQHSEDMKMENSELYKLRETIGILRKKNESMLYTISKREQIIYKYEDKIFHFDNCLRRGDDERHYDKLHKRSCDGCRRKSKVLAALRDLLKIKRNVTEDTGKKSPTVTKTEKKEAEMNSLENVTNQPESMEETKLQNSEDMGMENELYNLRETIKILRKKNESLLNAISKREQMIDKYEVKIFNIDNCLRRGDEERQFDKVYKRKCGACRKKSKVLEALRDLLKIEKNVTDDKGTKSPGCGLSYDEDYEVEINSKLPALPIKLEEDTNEPESLEKTKLQHSVNMEIENNELYKLRETIEIWRKKNESILTAISKREQIIYKYEGKISNIEDCLRKADDERHFGKISKRKCGACRRKAKVLAALRDLLKIKKNVTEETGKKSPSLDEIKLQHSENMGMENNKVHKLRETIEILRRKNESLLTAISKREQLIYKYEDTIFNFDNCLRRGDDERHFDKVYKRNCGACRIKANVLGALRDLMKIKKNVTEDEEKKSPRFDIVASDENAEGDAVNLSWKKEEDDKNAEDIGSNEEQDDEKKEDDQKRWSRIKGREVENDKEDQKRSCCRIRSREEEISDKEDQYKGSLCRNMRSFENKKNDEVEDQKRRSNCRIGKIWEEENDEQDQKRSIHRLRSSWEEEKNDVEEDRKKGCCCGIIRFREERSRKQKNYDEEEDHQKKRTDCRIRSLKEEETYVEDQKCRRSCKNWRSWEEENNEEDQKRRSICRIRGREEEKNVDEEDQKRDVCYKIMRIREEFYYNTIE
ncbi:myb-like protein X [Anneissia japonica]|uniref:myb-like protein X n=1 Tax=Anneissia japonica TaxID=1529436 RepID=UPI001425B7A7|nr:myb-like protein X [Anneissia japonica]